MILKTIGKALFNTTRNPKKRKRVKKAIKAGIILSSIECSKHHIGVGGSYSEIKSEKKTTSKLVKKEISLNPGGRVYSIVRKNNNYSIYNPNGEIIVKGKIADTYQGKTSFIVLETDEKTIIHNKKALHFHRRSIIPSRITKGNTICIGDEYTLVLKREIEVIGHENFKFEELDNRIKVYDGNNIRFIIASTSDENIIRCAISYEKKAKILDSLKMAIALKVHPEGGILIRL